MTLHNASTVSADEAASRCNAAMGEARRALVMGGYGCGNLGDEAILSVLLRDLRAGQRDDIRVVSANPRETAGLHGVDGVAATPVRLGRALRSCDALVIGGGGIFSGYMGKRSMALPALALAASYAGKKVVFRALGAYRTTPRPVARGLVAAMQRAAFVSVRDGATVDALDTFGLRRTVIREPDPALRLLRRPYGGALPQAAVGLALRRVRDPLTQHRLEGEFVRAINALVDAGRAPVLLPFSAHPSALVEQDAEYAWRLRSSARRPDRVHVVSDVRHPGEMLDVVARLDAIVAMRFHGIVFAQAVGTPVLAVPYDDKCASFADEQAIPALGLEHVTWTALMDALPDASSRAAA